LVFKNDGDSYYTKKNVKGQENVIDHKKGYRTLTG